MAFYMQSGAGLDARRVFASIAVAVLVSQSVFAVEQQGIQAGPGYFYPNAGLNVYYDDNLLSQQDNPIDSMVTVVSASGREEIYGDVSRYALEAGLDKAWYHASADDNYLDGRVFGEAAFFPSSRVATSAKGGYWRLHEDRGTTTLQGDLASAQDEPDIYDLWAIEGKFGYGLEEVGASKFEVLAAFQDREYTNNRLLTQFRDRDESTLEATFKYMVMPATSLLLEGRYKDFDYKRDEAQLDSNELRLRAGVTWEATAATTGFAKIGWQEKRFDSDQRKDGDKPAWDVGIEWSPLSYSTFGLITQRKFDESTGTGDFIDKLETRISWRHAWREFVSSDVYYSIGQDHYNGSSREDDVSGFGLSVDYSMRAYLDWSLYYNYQDRDSNVTGMDYDRNKFGVQARFAL
jgi:hypothetical protein